MRLFAVFALAVAAPCTMLAQHRTFTVDANASQVKMTLNTTHELVSSAFHIQSGSIDFNPNDAKMAGSVVVQAGSGNTGNGMRDKRMNNEILKVNQFATVAFAPQTYTGTIAPSGDSTIQVKGVFTLLGTPHDLTIPMQVHLDESKATATAHFTIPYIQWGVKDPSFMFWKAEHDVAIDLNLVGALVR